MIEMKSNPKTTSAKKPKYFVLSTYPKYQNNGYDFFLDLAELFENKGFKSYNTLKFGHYGLFFLELYALITIPGNALVVTIWPGFPRQLLVFKGFSNAFRFRLFRLMAKWKNWETVMIPMDLTLLLNEDRHRKAFIEYQKKLEKELFSYFDTFYTCGIEMTKYIRDKFPEKTIAMFDGYYQKLNPTGLTNKTIYPNSELKVLISGNLERMSEDLNDLPVMPQISYLFSGPNGNKLEEVDRTDIRYLGVIPTEGFINEIAQYDFGMIYYSALHAPYFSNVISGKLTTYVIAGLPVICLSRFTAMAELVERRNIGIVLESYSELNQLKGISPEEYQIKRENCVAFAQELTSGSMFADLFA